VAIRTAFKAVMGGKQVAILVPTTVLAQQHYQTFRERMSDYPVTIEMMSRFRTAAEQKKTAAGLTDGTVDIVVGTHRLISKDIQFKDLGLVVVDEEQRFGVLHKEKFKELFKKVDVLTLSATPIPRTLYLSLMGARDMSVIETPPQNRLPVETVVCGYDERIIRDAINRELARQGQVYFLHNRVMTIEKVANRILELCPQARIRIGHGQMDEHELEDVMRGFIDGEADVLISTTIIESGIDIPNANTIIIDRADRFGLADLYQLRGRVGRAQHKAYAYLMLPRDLMTVGAARKRVNAIKQYSSLGAGFKIAMRDLEIRGAGNVLGTAQSGHIINVGFDLYCQLLRQAVSKMKGEKVKPRIEITLRLDFLSLNEAEWLREPHLVPAFLPASYISEPKVRISAYRAHAEINNPQHLDKLRKTWRDRFGPLPEAAENLLTIAQVKLAAAATKITRVEVKDSKVMLTRGGDYILLGGKFPRLTSKSPEIALADLLTLLKKF
jgi:transcription-repair coupling factor (superfamily II helicase)